MYKLGENSTICSRKNLMNRKILTFSQIIETLSTTFMFTKNYLTLYFPHKSMGHSHSDRYKNIPLCAIPNNQTHIRTSNEITSHDI